jgi:clan AA aspartic protease (TIGR02281 family)
MNLCGISRPCNNRNSYISQGRTFFALLVTTAVWLGVPPPLPASFAAPVGDEAASPQAAHDIPRDEAIDFYQYTDDQGGIHFVDGREKIPARYLSRTIVRKDTPTARQTTKVVIADNQVHVPVTFKHGDRTEQATMLLDTGASMTVIDEELAARLNIDTTKNLITTIRVADGRSIEISVVTVDQVSVGSRSKTRMEIGILHHDGRPEQHDGLLGFDFLSDFQYQLDVANQLIRWQ